VVKKEEPVKAVSTRPVSVKEAPVKPELSKGAVSMSKQVSLAVRAKATVWLTVKADGVTVFQGNLKKGNAEIWTAKKKIELTGKDISLLDCERDGKLIENIGRRGTRPKRVVVTPDAISVE
jgi:hypothetical protein